MTRPKREPKRGLILSRPTDLLASDGSLIPALYVRRTDEVSSPGLVWFHGFASSKFKAAGIALALAEKGFPTLIPDLRGHGEHPAPFDEHVAEEARGAVRWMKARNPKVFALGSSLGGLLAVTSSADFAIALSPPMVRQPSAEGQYMLSLTVHEVREARQGILREVLPALTQQCLRADPKNFLVLYGTGEPPDIVRGIEEWAASKSVNCVRIPEGQIPDSEGPPGLVRYVPHWLNHVGFPSVAVSNDRLTEAVRRRETSAGRGG